MPWYNNLFKRSKNENIVNPCPIPDEPTLPVALQDYKNKNVVPPMSLSAFFAAVNLVSNSLAMMDWKFKDEDNNELPKTNYLNHLFDDSELTRFNIVKNIIQDIILYGNGFMYIERDEQTGKPIKLHYSAANQTTIWYDGLKHKTYYYNFTYSDRIDDGTNYLHFFMNTDNGYIGKGILKYAYNVLSIASIIQNATDSYYSTTGQQFGIVSPNGPLPEVGNQQKQLDKLKAKWEEVQSKSNKGTVFFPSDLKFTPMTNTAKDSSLIEAREYNAVEVGRFVANLSPVLLGDLRHMTYNSLTETQREFITHSLAPYVVMIEDQCNKKLIMPSKWGRQFIDLDENSILSPDKEKQANYLNTLVNSGIITRNEARNILGFAPIEGADILAVPYSNIQDNTIGGEETNIPDEDTQENNKQERNVLNH